MGDQQKKDENERKGRGLFYGVIAIATLILMAVGATFAYFTATTRSTDSAVQTGSTTIQLQYTSYEGAWMNKDLIPADTEIVEYSFEHQNDTTMTNAEKKNNILCKDDNGNSICSAYVFQVKNVANSPQSVSINLISQENGFDSLNAMTYEIAIPEDNTEYNSTENNNGTNDPKFKTGIDDEAEDKISVVDGNGLIIGSENYNPIYINRKGITKTLLKYKDSQGAEGTNVTKPSIDRLLVQIDETNQESSEEEKTTKLADDINIEGGETKTFAIVLYIKNENIDQTATNALKTFSGRVVISNGDGSTGISGVINASIGQEDTLQSRQ